MSTKFRYYIASVMNGEVTGTNDEAIAESIAQSEDDFVVDTEMNEWILSDQTRVPVAECKHVPEVEEGEDDPNPGISDRERI